MYSFLYETVFTKLTCPVIPVYTDTDSFILEFLTDGLNAQLAKIASDHLDHSSPPSEHPLHSVAKEGKLGFFKCETGGIPILEVVALRAKMYSVLLVTDEQIVRAKGVKKSILKRHLLHRTYLDALFYAVVISHEQALICSKRQCMYTMKNTKKCLVPFDDKRYLYDTIDSYPYGSCEYTGKRSWLCCVNVGI